MSNNKILAVVVVYNPDRELLHRNIESFINYVDKVLIWNNTPDDKHHSSCILQINTDKIDYLGTGENVGISSALNQAWKFAKQMGFDFILTMDQDSVWYDFEQYKDAVILKNKKEICICGPYALENINEKPLVQDFQPYRWQITSGMLIHTSLLDCIGGYNEFFKVDCVDIELCLRAKLKGYNSYYCPVGFLLQRYGAFSIRHILGRSIYYVYYNPSRIKGILEGHLLLYRYYKDPALKMEAKRYVNNAIRSILIGVNVPRLAIIKAIVQGLSRGLFYPLSKVFA